MPARFRLCLAIERIEYIRVSECAPVPVACKIQCTSSAAGRSTNGRRLSEHAETSSVYYNPLGKESGSVDRNRMQLRPAGFRLCCGVGSTGFAAGYGIRNPGPGVRGRDHRMLWDCNLGACLRIEPSAVVPVS